METDEIHYKLLSVNEDISEMLINTEHGQENKHKLKGMLRADITVLQSILKSLED